MDSPAGFDDDEDFFRRYDAERVRQSNSDLELESAEPPPSAEQLAHFGRFRKPVAYIFAAMSALSLTALALRGSEPIVPAPIARRELVARYAAALPAAPPVVSAAREAPVAPYEPVTWGMVSPAPSMCLLDSSVDSAWLTVALAEPPSFEGSEFESTAFRPSHSSSSRGRRPAHASNIGAHVAVSAHLAPSSARATPVLVTPVVSAPASPPLRSVARFPDPR